MPEIQNNKDGQQFQQLYGNLQNYQDNEFMSQIRLYNKVSTDLTEEFQKQTLFVSKHNNEDGFFLCESNGQSQSQKPIFCPVDSNAHDVFDVTIIIELIKYPKQIYNPTDMQFFFDYMKKFNCIEHEHFNMIGVPHLLQNPFTHETEYPYVIDFQLQLTESGAVFREKLQDKSSQGMNQQKIVYPIQNNQQQLQNTLFQIFIQFELASSMNDSAQILVSPKPPTVSEEVLFTHNYTIMQTIAEPGEQGCFHKGIYQVQQKKTKRILVCKKLGQNNLNKNFTDAEYERMKQFKESNYQDVSLLQPSKDGNLNSAIMEILVLFKVRIDRMQNSDNYLTQKSKFDKFLWIEEYYLVEKDDEKQIWLIFQYFGGANCRSTSAYNFLMEKVYYEEVVNNRTKQKIKYQYTPQFQLIDNYTDKKTQSRIFRQIIVDVLDILEVIFSYDIVHRDISLKNIFLRVKNGRIQATLGDMGLSGSLKKQCSIIKNLENRFDQSAVVEFLQQKQKYTQKIDLYLLGEVYLDMYQQHYMLTPLKLMPTDQLMENLKKDFELDYQLITELIDINSGLDDSNPITQLRAKYKEFFESVESY